jgi:hypothetical protein
MKKMDNNGRPATTRDAAIAVPLETQVEVAALRRRIAIKRYNLNKKRACGWPSTQERAKRPSHPKL